MGQDLYPFRGSCMDPNRKSPHCNQKCTDGKCRWGYILWTLAKETKVDADSFCNIVPCGPEGMIIRSSVVARFREMLLLQLYLP